MKQEQDSVFYQVNLTEREVKAIGESRAELSNKNDTVLPAILFLVGFIMAFIIQLSTDNDWFVVIAGLAFIIPGMLLICKNQGKYASAGKAFLKTIQGR